MEIDESARFELHEHLREVLGKASGDTLMNMLPPAGTEMATKADLAALKDQMTAEIHKAINQQTLTLAGIMVGIAAILTANNLF